MGFEYLTNVPLDKARKDYLELLKSKGFAGRHETVGVQNSCGRLTAGAVYANINAPHYAASAMDGERGTRVPRARDRSAGISRRCDRSCAECHRRRFWPSV